MNQLTLLNPGQFALADVAMPPAPGPDEALVRVHRVGVCGTDLHAYRGRQPFFGYPRVLGHELGVEVVALGNPTDHLRMGDRCAVEPYLNCGRCIACRRGKSNCCQTLNVLGVHSDGGMREYIIVPTRKLHPSALLNYEQLAIVETLAIGAHAVERAMPQPTDTVLIIGAGPIGLAVLEGIRMITGNVAVLDREGKRLAFVQRHYPNVVTLPATDDLTNTLRTTFGGDLPTVVFDATGNPASMMQAFQYVAPGGTFTFVGLFQGDVTFNDPHFHRNEITLLASRNALPATFTTLIDHIERGRIDTTPWITHRAHLTDVPTHFPTWLEPNSGVMKAVIKMG